MENTFTVRFTAGSQSGLDIAEKTRAGFEAELKDISDSKNVIGCYEPEARQSRRSGKKKGPGFYSVIFPASDTAMANEYVGQALLNIGSPPSLCGLHCDYT